MARASGRTRSAPSSCMTVFTCSCGRFLAGGTNDAEANVRRHGTVKLIPRISQGAWFVKQAVGTTPCLLGRKLTTSYHRCTNQLVLYTTHCWRDVT